MVSEQKVVTKKNVKRRHYNKNKQQKPTKQETEYQALFAKLSKNGVIVDGKISDSFKRKIISYTADQVQTYLENPSSYEKELRNVSAFLMQTQLHYWRTVTYMTNLAKICPIVIPNQIELIGVNDEEIRETYFSAIKMLDHMNVDHELGKVINKMFIEDVFYGIECDNGNSYYIKSLDPDYCRISSVTDGIYNFEFNLDFFSKDSTGKTFEGYCKFYPEFRYLMEQYKKNRGEDYQWVEIKPSKSICVKLQESFSACLPPFVASFLDLYDIDDYKKLSKNANEVGNFKLIGLQIPLNSKSGKVDDFLVDADTALKFYGMMEETLPDGVGAFLTPMIPKEIEFDTSSYDPETVSKAIDNYYNATGFSSIIFGGADTADAAEYSIKTDEMILTGSGGIYRQLERWLNRKFKLLFNGKVSINLLDVTSNNVKEKRKEYLEMAQYGVPCRSQLAALAGQTPLEMIALTNLENNILKLTDSWVPLSSSHTTSGSGTTSTNGQNLDDATTQSQQTQDRVAIQ